MLCSVVLGNVLFERLTKALLCVMRHRAAALRHELKSLQALSPSAQKQNAQVRVGEGLLAVACLALRVTCSCH